MARKAKQITKKEDLEFLLSLTEEKINKEFMMEAFGDYGDNPRFDPYDVFSVPPGSYGKEGMKNKNTFDTTVGLWVFNKFFIEKELFDQFKYISEGNINGKTLSKINEDMSYMILEDEITIPIHKRYLMKREWMMPYVSILSPNSTDDMLLSGDRLMKPKNKLIAENREELSKGNEVVAADVEKKLLAMAREELDDDPSMDNFNSGSRCQFDNHYKNMFLMKGAIMSTEPDGGFDIVTSSLLDGIKKSEYSVFSNSNIGGAYARAKNTQLGGYMGKLYMAALQHVILGEKDSDCKTSRVITAALTNSNINAYMYCYVKEGSKLIEITSKNRSSYIGKTVQMRFSSLCESEKICNKCMGNLLNRLGITHAGMACSKIPAQVMQWSLKRFHSSNIKIGDMDVMKAFGMK